MSFHADHSSSNKSPSLMLTSTICKLFIQFYFILGTYDVHVNNLTAPHPSRITRVLHHDHVDTLMDSFQENDCGQLVILVGMLTSEGINVATLKDEGSTSIEVLGGNHTREALQSLYLKGVHTCKTVKVNLYNPHTTTAALAIGYQHNAILHEAKRPLCFVDKVRLMRDCRPAVSMNKVELAEWKDMLVVVFRAKVSLISLFGILLQARVLCYIINAYI